MKPLSEEQRDEILAWVKDEAPYGWDWRTTRDFEKFLNQNTRKYEPPAVIWKTSGGTGAQKHERNTD